MKITKNHLYNNISIESQKKMFNCFKTTVKQYASGEVICFYDESNKGIGIIEDGSASVIHSLPSGSQTILEHLESGEIFGQIFYFHGNKENIWVEAVSDCTVMYFDYEHLIKRCPNACAYHTQLVHNVLEMISAKTQSICEHLEVLSQRSIREKLISYFDILSSKNNSKSFLLPYTMTALADYISVDRSAMSRELSRMKDEGLIKINRRQITLL